MPQGRFLSLTSDVMEKEGICFRHNAELLADVVLFLYFSISRSISLHHCSVLCVQLHLFAVERCAKWGQANISFLGGMVHRGLVGLRGHKGHLGDRTSLWARWGWCVTVFGTLKMELWLKHSDLEIKKKNWLTFSKGFQIWWMRLRTVC